MSYAAVGACPRCGSPIYAQSPWHGVTPPPSIPSCSCFPEQTMTTTTTTGILSIDGKEVNNNG